MSKIYVARQKIVNAKGAVFGYELLFRDTPGGIVEFPDHLTATSRVLLNTLTHMDLNDIIGEQGVAFLNADHTVLESNILEILNKERFVIEVLETIDLTPAVIEKIKYLRSRGYKIALDDFDCTAEMVKKFSSVFKYFNLIKIDVSHANMVSMRNVVSKFKKMGMRLLAEKVEDDAMMRECEEMGFDLFQGYLIDRPETIECRKMCDTTSAVVLQLIDMIKQNEETAAIEAYIRQRPELVYHMICYINSNAQVVEEIGSLTQAITLMGREQLLRWLLIYLYAEVGDGELSALLMKMAMARATYMEESVKASESERAYMTGMFSMLDILFDAEFEEIFKGLRLDTDLYGAIMHNDGPFAQPLRAAQKEERLLLKELLFDNYHLLDTGDVITILGNAGIDTSSKF